MIPIATRSAGDPAGQMSVPETERPEARWREYFSAARLRPDLRSKALTGASVTLAAQICAFAISTVGTVVLARLLTPHDYGLVTMVLAFSLLLQNFGINGFVEATIQKEEIDHSQVSALYWINLGINAALMLAFMASAPLVAWFYGDPALKPIVVVMALSILFGGASSQQQALLRRNMEFAKVAGIDVASTLGSLLIAIALAGQGWGYWALVARWVTAPLVMTVCGWVMCSWRPGPPARSAGVGPMIRFAFHTYGNFVLFYVCRTADKVLVGRFLGSVALGAYDRAFQLSTMMPSQLLNPLNSVAMPAFSRLRSDPPRFRRTYVTLLSIIAFVCMPVSAIIAMSGPDLILLILGPRWSSAGPILSVLGLSTGLVLIYSTHAWLHLSLGTPDKWLRWAVAAFVVTMGFLAAGLPFGAVGVAAGYACSLAVLTVPAIWYAGRPIELTVASIVGAVWKYTVAAMGAGIAVWFAGRSSDVGALVSVSPLSRVGVSAALSLCVYLLLVVLLHRGIEPISRLADLLRDMVPRTARRRAAVPAQPLT